MCLIIFTFDKENHKFFFIIVNIGRDLFPLRKKINDYIRLQIKSQCVEKCRQNGGFSWFGRLLICGKAKQRAQSHTLSGRLALKPGTHLRLKPYLQHTTTLHHCLLVRLNSIIQSSPSSSFRIKFSIMPNHLWVHFFLSVAASVKMESPNTIVIVVSTLYIYIYFSRRNKSSLKFVIYYDLVNAFQFGDIMYTLLNL